MRRKEHVPQEDESTGKDTSDTRNRGTQTANVAEFHHGIAWSV
jgi:hypothetical protein